MLESANSNAQDEWQECGRLTQENLAASLQTLQALQEAHGQTGRLADDVASRRMDLTTTEDLVQELRTRLAAETPKETEAELSAANPVASLAGVAVAATEAGEVEVTLLGTKGPDKVRLRFAGSRSGGRPSLRGAELVAGNEVATDVKLDDVIALAVALDDPAFLIEQLRSRLRCARARAAEVATLSRSHLLFDQNGLLRVTFATGVMVSLLTGPDYPHGLGGIRLTALETMGVFSDDIQSCRVLTASCSSLTEVVQALSTRFAKKKK